MNIFLIGGSGFLGRHVICELLKKDRIHKVYCLVHHTEVPAEGEKVVKVKGSIKDLKTVRIADKIDVCVVLAGITDGVGADAGTTMEINYKGMMAAIAYCKKNRIGRICFTSSVNVKMDRQGAYAISKQKAERAVKGSGLSYLIFRPALIYGEGSKKGLGVIEHFIKRYGLVPVFGNGRKLEQPIWVGECAALISWYLLAENWDRTIELYGRDAMAYDQMCRRIAAANGRKVRLVHIPLWFCEPGLRILEAFHIKFPVSREQVYHIDTDLAGDMSGVYEETGLAGDSFENNLNKGQAEG